MSNNNTATAPETKPFDPIAEFGKGVYSNLMKEAYADSKRELGFTHAQALKFAKQLGSDMGALNMRRDIKISGLKKDGTCTVKDAGTLKGVLMTPALNICKILTTLQDLKKFGLLSVTNPIFNDGIESFLERPVKE